MSKAVKISDYLAKKATIRAKVMHRSIAGQVEHWANIGQIAEDNPDLSFAFINNILIGLEEARAGEVENYIFGEGSQN